MKRSLKYSVAFLLTLAGFMLFLPMNVQAQNVTRALDQISRINRIEPLQNPDYKTYKDIIGRKVTDRKNKVIGQVEDITLNTNGSISAIVTDFDRLRLSHAVSLNFRQLGIRTLSNSYSLNLKSNEVEDFYPQLLANIETAAGDNEIYSVRDIIGASINTEKDHVFGRVKDVLFSGNGSRAAALYIEIRRGNARGDTVAIPFKSASLESKNGSVVGRVSQNIIDALVDIAER